MKFKIYWTKGDVEDSMIIEGDSIAEIQERASAELAKRNPDDYWSEEM